MIGRIRNPWIRRTLVIVSTPFFLATISILAAIAAAVEEADTVRDAWKGPTT